MSQNVTKCHTPLKWHTYNVALFLWRLPSHEPHSTYDWVMSHKWMSHVTQVNESCHTYNGAWFWRRLPSHCPLTTYEWVMSHIWMSRVTHTMARGPWEHIATHYNTLQHTTTHHNTLQHTATHYNTLQHAAAYCDALRHTRKIIPSRGPVTTERVSCSTLKWVMSHIWMSHVTHMNGSCHTMTESCSAYNCVWSSRTMTLTRSWHCHVTAPVPLVSYVTHMNESCHTYEWVMSIWMSHVTHMNESCPYESVMSHIWVWPRTISESCHTYEWVVSHTWVWSHVTE